jgi:hypothetical protein
MLSSRPSSSHTAGPTCANPDPVSYFQHRSRLQTPAQRTPQRPLAFSCIPHPASQLVRVPPSPNRKPLRPKEAPTRTVGASIGPLAQRSGQALLRSGLPWVIPLQAKRRPESNFLGRPAFSDPSRISHSYVGPKCACSVTANASGGHHRGTTLDPSGGSGPWSLVPVSLASWASGTARHVDRSPRTARSFQR